jgi:VWFA-related protein
LSADQPPLKLRRSAEAFAKAETFAKAESRSGATSPKLAVEAVASDGGQAKPAEEPQQPAPVFRAGTDLVRVDVSATGRNGVPVADLHASDFEVEEDGVLQTVQTAQFIRITGQRTSDLNEPLEIRSREHAKLEAAREDVRLFAIFLDDYHVAKSPTITLPLRDALAKFVEQFQPNDLVVVMDPLTTLDGLKFTRSQPDLVARMRSFVGRRNELFPVKSAVEEAQLTQRNWIELRGGVTLSALTALATHLGGLREGRKSILFVSQGPPLGPPGSPNDDRLKEALQAANRGNVTIHVLDPRPLGAVGFGGHSTLQRIAGETGGRAIVNTNDPSDELTRVIADASAYYLIGYSPTRQTNDGKFHKITVRVKRRGVDVTARRGYWAASEKELTAAAEAAATPPNPVLANALRAMAVSTSVSSIELWTGMSRGPGALTRLTVTWEANQRTGDKPARLELQPVDGDGKPVLEPQVIAGAPGEIPLIASYDVEPGRFRVRFTSHSSSGDVLDRWVQNLIIPSLAEEPLGLATPRFLRARSMAELRMLEANPNPAPVAGTLFRRTERVLMDVECYAPEAAMPELSIDLLNAKGDPLRALDIPPPVNGRTRIVVPVASLAPSIYVVRIRASDGERTVEQMAAFRVTQ